MQPWMVWQKSAYIDQIFDLISTFFAHVKLADRRPVTPCQFVVASMGKAFAQILQFLCCLACRVIAEIDFVDYLFQLGSEQIIQLLRQILFINRAEVLLHSFPRSDGTLSQDG